MRLDRRSALKLLAALAPAASGLRQVRTVLAATPEGQWRHGLSLFGNLKYPADFKHFDYVNPQAPKGGRVRIRRCRLLRIRSIPTPTRAMPPGSSAHQRHADDQSPRRADDRIRPRRRSAFSIPRTSPSSPTACARAPAFTTARRSRRTTSSGRCRCCAVPIPSIPPTTRTSQGRADRRPRGDVRLRPKRAIASCRRSSASCRVLPKHWWTGKDANGSQRDINETTLEPPLGSGALSRSTMCRPGRIDLL